MGCVCAAVRGILQHHVAVVPLIHLFESSAGETAVQPFHVPSPCIASSVSLAKPLSIFISETAVQPTPIFVCISATAK